MPSDKAVVFLQLVQPQEKPLCKNNNKLSFDLGKIF
jgi:hypothetical protein